MSTPPALVVAVDFATHAADICAAAAELAARLDARVVLLHVMRLGDGLRPDTAVHPRWADGPMTAEAMLRADATREMAPLVALVEGHGVRAELCLRLGAVTDEVTACVTEVAPLMLVIGSDIPAGLARLFRTGFTEAIIQASPCPVLVVRTRATPPPGPSAGQTQARAEADG